MKHNRKGEKWKDLKCLDSIKAKWVIPRTSTFPRIGLIIFVQTQTEQIDLTLKLISYKLSRPNCLIACMVRSKEYKVRKI